MTDGMSAFTPIYSQSCKYPVVVKPGILKQKSRILNQTGGVTETSFCW